MKALEKRAAELAARAKDARLDQLRVALDEKFARGAVEMSDDAIEVTGEGLLRRWLEDASIRFIGMGQK